MTIAPLRLEADTLVSMPCDRPLGRVPYITASVFYSTSGFACSVKEAAADRRLSRADVSVAAGGLETAIRVFSENETPDLLVVEVPGGVQQWLASLDALAEVCDPKTKVVLIGTSNDISLYQQLMARGIAEYIVAPVHALSFISVIVRLFPQNASGRIGKVLACIGAKGGSGSSTIAQNIAWCLAEGGEKVMLADLDLQFGTAALNYNIDAPVGFAEQLGDADRLDDALLERLLYKRGQNLSVLTGATASREITEPDLAVLDKILDLARATFPVVVLDLPHHWSAWVRRALLASDDVIITAAPDLASLRNTRMLCELLKETRHNDREPRLVLNQFGRVRRAEVKPAEFAAAAHMPAAACIGFDPVLFGEAASKGKMLAEISSRAAPSTAVELLAQDLSGRAPRAQAPRRKLFWTR